MADKRTRGVLVIGGSRGIGAAVVRVFAHAGDDVTFTYRGAEAAASTLSAETGAVAIQSDAADRAALLDLVRSKGPLDVFIFNAGVEVVGDPLLMAEADVDRMIDLNIRSAYYGCVEAARRMPEGGRIIIMGSVIADRVIGPGQTVYCMTKTAVQGIARGLARDLGSRGITVNVVQPGPTDTDMNPANGPRAPDMHAAMALKRHGSADEVAALVFYLSGSSARGITGAMHTVDGGFVG